MAETEQSPHPSSADFDFHAWTPVSDISDGLSAEGCADEFVQQHTADYLAWRVSKGQFELSADGTKYRWLTEQERASKTDSAA